MQKTNGELRVICAFYASTTYGSEYRAGLEFIRFAASNGFDLAIVADLEENSPAMVLEAEAPGIRVVRIPSPVKRQATLYRFSDVIPQTIWHLRVARWLAKETMPLHTLWIQNGAQPWLPLVPYFALASNLIWGPTGGGEPPPVAMLLRLDWKTRVRERVRSLVEEQFLRNKLSAVARRDAPRFLPLARTVEVQRRLGHWIHSVIPVIPEILDPLSGVTVQRTPSYIPRFVWVGQDIPRKNLQLALEIFAALRRDEFPDSTLDVFGCTRPGVQSKEGVTFHGWVPRIDWPSFQNDGVLLLTSFREGLPSVVLEAARHGLLSVTTDVGAISSLGINTLHILPRDEYPNFSSGSLWQVAARIRLHLAQHTINLPPVSHTTNLANYLRAEGIIQ